MSCWRIQPLLVAHIEDELPSDEATLVETHLEDCPPCAELSKGLADLPSPPQFVLPDAALEEVWAKLDSALQPSLELAARGQQPRKTTRRGGWQRFIGSSVQLPWAVAAAYMFCLVGLTGWNLHTQGELQQLRDTQRNLLSAPSLGMNGPLVAPPSAGAALDLQLVDYGMYGEELDSALAPLLLEAPPRPDVPAAVPVSLH